MNAVATFPEKLKAVKDAGEDFEWYPTTETMIRIVFEDVEKNGAYDQSKLLDIGAGDGNLFKVWDKLVNEKYPKDQHGYRPNHIPVPREYFAIERSHTLINFLPKDIVVVGTDFRVQTLIDKKMDVIFCNPPYSEYSQWMIKAILEADTTLLYMIVPERWEEKKEIYNAIHKRQAVSEILCIDNFLNAERAARAKVHILRIDFRGQKSERFGDSYYDKRRNKTDPFDVWFESTFDTFDKQSSFGSGQGSLKDRLSLAPGQNLIERLELMYQQDIEHIQNVYASLQKIDPVILMEIGVSVNEVSKSLREKLSSLKVKYWKELFDNLTKLTSRLTSKSRKDLLEKLQKNVSVDFSANNAYAIVIWAIKHANEYYDKQLIEAYENLITPESAIRYKSNARFATDEWKFRNAWDFVNQADHYYINDTLDYRIVCHRVGGIHNTDTYQYYDRHGLQDRAYEFIQDLCTIASNLGYNPHTVGLDEQWESGQQRIIWLQGDTEALFSVRAFKNGNLHFKINQQFLRKLNVEFGRLKGWINNKAHASEEMDIPMKEMAKLFKCNFQIEKGTNEKLLEYVV